MLRALSCLSLFLTFNQNRIFSNLTLIHTFIPFFLSFFFYKPVSGYQDLGGSISFCLGTDQWLPITVSNTAGHSWPWFFPTWQGLTLFFFLKWNSMQAVMHWYFSMIRTSLGYLKKKKKKKWEGGKPQSGCKPCIPVLSWDTASHQNTKHVGKLQKWGVHLGRKSINLLDSF